MLNLLLKSCFFIISLGYVICVNYKEIIDLIDIFFNKMNLIKSLVEKSVFGWFKGCSNYIIKKGGCFVNWELLN